MIFIITVPSAVKKDSIFVLTAIELAEAATTGSALAGWHGTSTSESSPQKATQQITSSHTSCQRGGTHDQAHPANLATLKKALFANGATHSQMLATGTAIYVLKVLGDIALHA